MMLELKEDAALDHRHGLLPGLAFADKARGEIGIPERAPESGDGIEEQRRLACVLWSMAR